MRLNDIQTNRRDRTKIKRLQHKIIDKLSNTNNNNFYGKKHNETELVIADVLQILRKYNGFTVVNTTVINAIAPTQVKFIISKYFFYNTFVSVFMTISYNY